MATIYSDTRASAGHSTPPRPPRGPSPAPPWHRQDWKERARPRNPPAAAFAARLRHGSLTPRADGGATDPEARKTAPNHARFVANQFCPLNPRLYEAVA